MILWADGGGGMVVTLGFSIQIKTVPVWYVAFASKGHKTQKYEIIFHMSARNQSKKKRKSEREKKKEIKREREGEGEREREREFLRNVNKQFS